MAVISSVKFIGADGWLRYPRRDHCYKSLDQDWENHSDKGTVSDLSHKFIAQVLLDSEICTS